MKTINELLELVNQANLRAHKVAKKELGICLQVRFSWHVNQMEVSELTMTDGEWRYKESITFHLDTEDEIQAAYWFLKTQPFGI